MGFKGAKVVVYPAGSSAGVAYEGETKFEPLTAFLKDLAEGKIVAKSTSAETPVPPAEPVVSEGTPADGTTKPEAAEPKPTGRPGDEL